MRNVMAIKELRKKRGLRQRDLAEALDVEQATVQRWETGNRTMDSKQIVQLAEVLGVDPGALFGAVTTVGIGPKLHVKGAVAAGVWCEAIEWNETDWQDFYGRADVTSPLEMRFGLRVDGESMNIPYPPGTIIECVSFLGGVEIASGKRVVVVRKRDNGDYEATVKEYLIDAEGKEWLVPRSHNPAFQVPIEIGRPEPGIIETRITAIVVGSYRPE